MSRPDAPKGFVPTLLPMPHPQAAYHELVRGGLTRDNRSAFALSFPENPQVDPAELFGAFLSDLVEFVARSIADKRSEAVGDVRSRIAAHLARFQPSSVQGVTVAAVAPAPTAKATAATEPAKKGSARA